MLNSFSEFFYNLLPGIIFLLLLDKLVGLPLERGNDFIFMVIVWGLFIGFVFQGINRVLKNPVLGRVKVYEKIKKEYPDTFKQAEDVLKVKKVIFNESSKKGESKEGSLEDLFYKMDNYVRGESQGALVNHFAGKAALWSNLLWASVATFIVACWEVVPNFFSCNNVDSMKTVILAISPIIIVLSYHMSLSHWESQYSTVLKTFLIIIRLDKGMEPTKMDKSQMKTKQGD